MRLRTIVAIGLLLGAAGCQDRNGLDFSTPDGGLGGYTGPGSGGKGGSGGSGGSAQGGSAQGGSGGLKSDAGPTLCPGDYPCAIDCQYGTAHDDSGCPLCKCNPPPVCPAGLCKLYCASGFKKDAQGCNTCECNQPPICPPLDCKSCPNGYRKDANGCDTCVCIEPPICPDIACPAIACPYGNQKDANGCVTCGCNPPPVCKAIACPAIYCPNGFAKDPNGCTTCGCATPCKPTGAACAVACPYGYATDPNGCTTCKCNPPPTCKPLPCQKCPNGYVTDANGCSTCQCLPSPACGPNDCPGPVPGAPTRMCSDGSTAGPVCQRNPDGACGWAFKDCPPDCNQVSDPYACNSLAHCTWLQPGCSEPSIPAAGCYARTLIGCGDRMLACPGGKQCQKRTINPCANPPYGGPGLLNGSGAADPAGPGAPAILIPPPACNACAAPITICL